MHKLVRIKKREHARSSTVCSAMTDISATERPVLFLDSGVGGLPYLRAAAAELPSERLVYLADRSNFPYGEKSPAEVRRAIVAAAGEAISAHEPKAAVVACNTASVVALQALRREFGIAFVGVVPAVKPAAQRSLNRRIGVLATARTVEDRYLAELIAQFAADCYVLRVAGGDIVSFVEQRFFVSRAAERRAIVDHAAALFREAGVDTVVLGCTHFLHVERELCEALGSAVHVIDSREGVTRRLAALLHEHQLFRAGPPAEGSLYVTRTAGCDPMRNDDYACFAEQFQLRYRGALPVRSA